MITIRPAKERGHANHGWLDTYHTFSFSSYYDPKHMGFRSLRVINDDKVAPGYGFGTHPHNDMEIVTYVLEGELAHKDSMGTGSTIVPGEVQRMSAGTGVLHSEFNHSKIDEVHLLQIWILPEKKGLEPSYEQKFFADEEKLNKWRVVASRDAREGSVTIHQDAAIYATLLEDGKDVEYRLEKGRHAWLHVATGSVKLNGKVLNAGDGAAMSDESEVKLTGATTGKKAEVLLFDLA
ncbi:MAG TPA: pirin family protein [Terriglobales bacterium]|nr:pirin family protein [Terriglobales bacterium]